MSLRRSSIVLAVIGVLLIVAAGVVRFFVVPSLSQLPSDFSQTVNVTGTSSALNGQALAQGDLANLATPKTPFTAVRKLTVDATDGSTAIVTNAVITNLPGGGQRNDVHTFAVDRKTMKPVTLSDDQKSDLVPDNRKKTFEDQTGYAFSYPSDLTKKPLALYDTMIRTDRPAQFASEKTIDGRTVYDFTIDSTGPVRDPALLAQSSQLPKMLPKGLIGGLMASGNVPTQSVAALSAGMAAMPDMVTPSVIATTSGSLGIDKQFGSPVSTDQTQNVYLAVPVNGVATPVLTLSSVALSVPQAQTAALVDDLNDTSRTVDLAGIWGPLAAVVVGLVLIAAAVVLQRRPRTARVQD